MAWLVTVPQLGEVRDFYPLIHKRSTNFKQTRICQTKHTTPHLAKLLLADGTVQLVET